MRTSPEEVSCIQDGSPDAVMPSEKDVNDPRDSDEEAALRGWHTHRAPCLGERADDVRLDGPGTPRGVAAALAVNTRSSHTLMPRAPITCIGF